MNAIKDIYFEFAAFAEKEAIEQMLMECELPHEDISNHLIILFWQKTKRVLLELSD